MRMYGRLRTFEAEGVLRIVLLGTYARMLV
jgi:hypothetical protein